MNIRSARVETDLPGIMRIVNPYESRPVTIEKARSWFAYNTPGRVQLRLVAVDEEDAVIGYSVMIHDASTPARHFYAWLSVDAACRCQGIGSALWEASMEFLLAQGATRLGSEVLDHDAAGLDFAEKRGFTIDRHNYPSTLDLAVFDETPFLPGIAALEAQGIRFCALADFPDTPETRRKFYELNLAVVRDIPGEDWDFTAYPLFFKDHIVGAAWFRREGQLLAVDGDDFVGLGSVSLHPETHSAYNATTGVIRTYRGRKIALALKVLAARYARQHGALRVNTDNDSLNTPILAVNRKMGYEPRPGKYLLVRWLGENEPQVTSLF